MKNNERAVGPIILNLLPDFASTHSPFTYDLSWKTLEFLSYEQDVNFDLHMVRVAKLPRREGSAPW